MSHKLKLLFILFFVVVLDRITKSAIISRFHEGDGFPVWPGVFHITRVNNTGAAFGMLRHSPLLLAVIAIVCILLLGFTVLSRNKSSEKTLSRQEALLDVAWMFIIAGAAGNLYDRLVFAYVIDFLDFRVWPVFNVADISICLGVGLAACSLLQKKAA